MSAVHNLNPKAEHMRRGQALEMNISAAEAIMEVIKTNFGPAGTLKMLVGGAGDIRITKDGAVLLDELPVQHPSIALVQRTVVAVDDVCGDGTTQCVILIGELLRQARRWLQEGVHPRVLVDGFQIAKETCLATLDNVKETLNASNDVQLLQAARACIGTKLKPEMADKLAEICVGAVRIAEKNTSTKRLIDLATIEIMVMQHHADLDTELIHGIVMDHGWRHQELKTTRFEKCWTLTLNLPLEYEKAEVNTEYFYKSAEEKVQQAEKEREFVNKRVQKIIDMKEKICGPGETVVVFNEKGIDPESLEMLARHGIMALRRVKRRNMERLTLCCGGSALNTLDDLSEKSFGYAEEVYEELLGEEKFTFVRGVRNPRSCTVLLRGPSKHAIGQVRDALRDGLRSVKNLLVDKEFVWGAGAIEAQMYNALVEAEKKTVSKARMGIQAFADAILGIPKCLARNAGLDQQDAAFAIARAAQDGSAWGLELKTGQPKPSKELGVIDSIRVKKQVINSAAVIATQLLQVDEVLRAGRAVRGGTEMDEIAAE